ncbi:unnamed protein product [Clonostachys byssicola]|uniref:SRR1-like domain-containing protein n=1 Tax=Clonostachys byssicola TaxID=160290 RepID=A0A9N9UBZ6_9HYPO|nr:unnamed protein product [Clonostachys byssicola]
MAEMAFTSDFLNNERETMTKFPNTTSPVSRDAEQRDLRKIQAAWNHGWLTWGSNPDHAELLRSLKLLAPKLPEVSKVLCLGLGTLDGDLLVDEKAGDGRVNHHNITQHMFAVTLTKTLSKLLGTRIPLMAFDLEYSENDKQILSRNEIEVIEGYVAVTEIDNKTLVVSLDPTFPLEQVIADFVKPAAMIWDQAVFVPKTTLRVYYDKFFTAPLRFGKTNVAIRKPIIDDLANAIETEMEFPKANGMAKHGCGKTYMDDMDEGVIVDYEPDVVIVDYEPEDEWELLE